MTWAERIQKWTTWLNLEIQNTLWKNTIPGFVIQNLSGTSTKEAADSYYESLPENIKNDPDVKKAYEKFRDEKQSLTKDVVDKIVQLAADAEKELLGIMDRVECVPVAEAKATALKLLAADTVANVGIGVAGVTVEALGMGQIDTFTDFHKFLRARTGYGGPMTMLMKAPVEMALMRPLSYQLHDTFRNEIPALGDFITASMKGDTTKMNAVAEFNKSLFGAGRPVNDDGGIYKRFMAFKGFPEWHANAIWEGRWNEPSLREIGLALMYSDLPEKILKDKLQRAGYSPEDIEWMYPALREQLVKPYRDRVINQLRNLYKEGYIDQATFKARLTQLNAPAIIQNLLVVESEYYFTYDYNYDMIGMWQTAYKNDIISEDILRGNLATIIKDPRRIESAVYKAKTARRPATIAEPKATTQGIRISSKPTNAYIILDGADTGKLTAETLTMAAGKHRLRIEADGYEDAEYDIDVPAGIFIEIYAILEKIE